MELAERGDLLRIVGREALEALDHLGDSLAAGVDDRHQLKQRAQGTWAAYNPAKRGTCYLVGRVFSPGIDIGRARNASIFPGGSERSTGE